MVRLILSRLYTIFYMSDEFLSFLSPTVVFRHRRENLKKCSLKGLETHPDFIFLTYPECQGKMPALFGYVVLDIDGEELLPTQQGQGFVLLDATWRLADKMKKGLKGLEDLPHRRLPKGFQTAYPRRQEDCRDPSSGLSSIEALFIAYTIVGKEASFLLDHYYWKEQFLSKNHSSFLDIKAKNVV
jgi:pre-rRNA-processing protein TSR3